MKLSDLKPGQYQVESQPASLRLSELKPGQYEIEAAEAPKQARTGQAAIEGFGQGAAMGYLPQLQAIGGLLMPDPGRDVDAKLKSEGFEIAQPKDTYVSLRDENIRRQKELQEEAPGAYIGGQLAGAVATAPVVGKAITKIPGMALAPKAGLSGLLARTGQAAAGGAIQAAVQNPGDMEGVVADDLQMDQRLENAKTGAKIGAITQVGGEALLKGAKTVANSASGMTEWAKNKAFKASGAMLKDFRKAFGKGKVSELGEEMLNSGLANPGSTFEDVAQKSSELKSQVGERIGQIYDKITASGTLSIDPRKLYSTLVDAVSDSKVRPKLNVQAYDDAMDRVITDIAKKGNGLSDVRVLNDLIGEIDDMINHSKRMNDLPVVQQGYMKIRQALRSQLNDLAEAVGNMSGNTGLKDELMALNRRYGNLSEIASIAKDRVARESSNRMFGLTDTLAGVGGLAAGGAYEGVKEGDLGKVGKGLLIGAGAALANKAGRTYGVPILAQGAYKAGGLLSQVPVPVNATIDAAKGFIQSNPGLIGAASGNYGTPTVSATSVESPQPMLMKRDTKATRKPADK